MARTRRGRGWYGEPQRHRLAALGQKTVAPRTKAMLIMAKPGAPLEKKSTKLPLQLSINVPSTDYDKKITPQQFNKRIKNTAKEFSDRFGGDTSIKGKGDYTSKGQLIREDVAIIESSMTRKDYQKNKSAIERFIKEKKKDWKQETIGYSFEGDFYIYPAF